MIVSWQELDDKPRQCVEKLRHYSANKGLYSQSYGMVFPVVTWGQNCKEGRTPKNWCLWTVVLEKIPESPLDSKEIKPVNLKGDQPWIFTKGLMLKAEVPVFWSSDANRQFTGKIPGAGKDWGQQKRAAEDEMVGCYHWCNEYELWQTPGDGDEQGGLACCSPWGCKESDTIGWLNNIKINAVYEST